jgi:hypothetical protein
LQLLWLRLKYSWVNFVASLLHKRRELLDEEGDGLKLEKDP